MDFQSIPNQITVYILLHYLILDWHWSCWLGGALICILYKNRFRITNEEVAVFAVIILILALIYNIFECTIPPIIPAFVLECIGEGYLKKISKSSEDEDERGPQYWLKNKPHKKEIYVVVMYYIYLATYMLWKMGVSLQIC